MNSMNECVHICRFELGRIPNDAWNPLLSLGDPLVATHATQVKQTARAPSNTSRCNTAPSSLARACFPTADIKQHVPVPLRSCQPPLFLPTRRAPVPTT
jgi:hypothetical protein